MTTRELMIGNYVMAINNYEDIFYVNCIYGYRDLNITSGIYKNYDTTIKDIKPIPLTEEWLLKFGLNNPTNEKPYHFKKSAVEFLHSEFQDELKCFCNDKPMFSFPCKYVHQLQNIYYSITGEELKINKL